MTDYTIRTEYVEEEKRPFREFKKSLWNGSAWEVIKFYELKKPSSEKSKINNWLTEHYKGPQYSRTWWETWDGIVMHEKIYVHWKLCE